MESTFLVHHQVSWCIGRKNMINRRPTQMVSEADRNMNSEPRHQSTYIFFLTKHLTNQRRIELKTNSEKVIKPIIIALPTGTWTKINQIARTQDMGKIKACRLHISTDAINPPLQGSNVFIQRLKYLPHANHFTQISIKFHISFSYIQ